jgi:small-conductance mechanosensitive channel
MTDITKFFTADGFRTWMSQIEAWLESDILEWSSAAQLLAIVVAWGIAAGLAPSVRRLFGRVLGGQRFERQFGRIGPTASAVTLPMAWLVLLWFARMAAKQAEWPHWLIGSAESLLTAWIVIRIASTLIRDAAWGRAFAIVAWCVAAADIFGLLTPTITALEAASITLGDFPLSAWGVIKGIITLVVLLWAATFLSSLLERRIGTLPSLTPSVQVLFSKLLKIFLVTIAVVAALSTVGVDLTAFAVFSGAIGVGIGFGLQKIFSNLISGIILLVDKSVKPGDVIAVEGYFGRIDTLNARYASVITRDGVEHLIPNEELITQRVENWSHSNELLRLRRPVGISYNSDLRLAIELCLRACDSVERVLKDPKPNCLVKGFGDSSVDLEMRFWINDPMNGRANVTSEVYLHVWDLFREHGIQIPYPQRDLHLRSPDILTVAGSANRDIGT